ncbi:MAG: septum formation initiator family protein [Lachnospiraceae bacterium]|nr:septum formation initiator family protein [Lachnospiraceae bacterium]
MAARRNSGYSYKKKMNPFTMVAVFVLCFVLCGTLAYKTVNLHAQKKSNQKQIEQLQAQQKDLEEEQDEIKQFGQRVGTDEYIEDVARDKLGLVYEGEIVFKPEDK